MIDIKESLVSIIMPAYNAEKYIVESINSVVSQTYKNWELIICEDCSTDRTMSIILEFQKNNKKIMVLKNKENCGAAASRNKAIEKANGEFIAFLDSDDTWLNEKLTTQINYMNNNNYDFTCTYYNKIDSTGQDLNKIIKYKKTAVFSDLLKESPGNSTVIYNAKKLGKFFIPKIKKRNDYLMWFQVIKKSNEINCLQEVLSSHRLVENSLSSSKRTLVKYHWRIYKRELGLGYIKSSYYCAYWMLKGIKNIFKN
ncbi:glycosyltransferase family 2 protein [Vagococcus fluvialis]|uniref:glycosyltransferase family 2 protein n=1 Tax=Vagococcus fluvialis TaxID=2738 RepID=UPI003B219C78